MHEIASLSLYSFSKFSGGACPQIPLEARAFDTRMPSRLLLDPSHLLQNLMRTLIKPLTNDHRIPFDTEYCFIIYNLSLKYYTLKRNKKEISSVEFYTPVIPEKRNAIYIIPVFKK